MKQGCNAAVEFTWDHHDKILVSWGLSTLKTTQKSGDMETYVHFLGNFARFGQSRHAMETMETYEI